jgi:hypothetical protein
MAAVYTALYDRVVAGFAPYETLMDPVDQADAVDAGAPGCAGTRERRRGPEHARAVRAVGARARVRALLAPERNEMHRARRRRARLPRRCDPGRRICDRLLHTVHRHGPRSTRTGLRPPFSVMGTGDTLGRGVPTDLPPRSLRAPSGHGQPDEQRREAKRLRQDERDLLPLTCLRRGQGLPVSLGRSSPEEEA